MTHLRANETSGETRAVGAAMGLALSLTVAACGGNGMADAAANGDEAASGAEVGSVEQLVQADAAGNYNLDFNNNKQKATGVIALPWLSDGSVWASCGVTFVSRHFAITAAHCVPKDKAPLDTRAFFVQNINVDDFSRRAILGEPGLFNKFIQSHNVTANGPFPNWTQGPPLTAADGYRFGDPAALQCGAVVRCQKDFGTERCPANLLSQNGGNGVDIALIQCPDRATTRPFVTVFSGDETTGMAVEAHWSHEMLKLSMEPNDGIGPAGNFANYGAFNPGGGDAAKANNWHYRGLLNSQFFPLISRTFPNGTTYKTTADTTAGATERFTTVFACHGTSGSGVFPQNSDQLLGPAVHGGSTWTDRLCTPPSTLTTNTDNLSFVRPSFTRQLEAMVTFDR